jgi:hypothetical protein
MAARLPRLVRPALAGAVALTISTAAVAPAGVLAQDRPEAPVSGFLEALAEKRFDDLSQYVCPGFADQVAGYDIAAAMASDLPPGIDPQLLLDALSISVTGP